MIILILLGVTFLIVFKEKSDVEVDNTPPALEKLSDILKSTDYFKEADISIEKDEMKLVVDNNDIFIKNNYYLLNARNKEQEEFICKVIDALSINYGNNAKESIKTCELSLSGIANISGINVEISDNIKSVKIDSISGFSLYNPVNVVAFKELIPLEKINYTIEQDGIIFTNMTNRIDENLKKIDICGNIYLKPKKKEFVFKVYDELKNIIDEQHYEYSSSEQVAQYFCVSFEANPESIKYYSIEDV